MITGMTYIMHRVCVFLATTSTMIFFFPPFYSFFIRSFLSTDGKEAKKKWIRVHLIFQVVTIFV